MNLKHLSDQELLKNTEILVKQEREMTTKILHQSKLRQVFVPSLSQCPNSILTPSKMML